MGTIWLIRHGETAFGDGEPRYCGRSDVPLTPRGLAQAEAIAAALAARPLTAIYVTGLLRTAQTAAPLARRIGVTPTVCAALREIDYGGWEGCSYAEIDAQWPAHYAEWKAAPDRVAPPDGETFAQLAARIEPAFHALAQRHAGDEIAIIAHKSVNRTLLCCLLGLPVSQYLRICQEPGAINRILLEPHRIVVAGVNDRCHLHA